MAQAVALYQLGLQIYRAINTILAPGATNAQIAAAIGTINATTAAYQNAMSNMWNFLQPYFPHYNPAYVTAWERWINHGVTEIDTAVGPIALDGNAHGGVYSPAVIAAQTPNLLVCMGDLNVFRNPYNAAALNVPYWNAVGLAAEVTETPELVPGDFDPDEIGLTAKAEGAFPSTGLTLPDVTPGDTVYFGAAADSSLSVLAVYPDTGNLLVLGDPDVGGEPDFLVTMYELGGDGTAKISLEWTDAQFWIADGGSGAENALMTGDGPAAQFLLTDTGAGISMQLIFPEEGGYVAAVGDAAPFTMTYGNSATSPFSLFTMTVEP